MDSMLANVAKRLPVYGKYVLVKASDTVYLNNLVLVHVLLRALHSIIIQFQQLAHSL